MLKLEHKDTKFSEILVRCKYVYENDTKKLKRHSRRNEEQLKFKQCLLHFSSESFVFPSSVVKQ
jgi:hypothetical protein